MGQGIFAYPVTSTAIAGIFPRPAGMQRTPFGHSGGIMINPSGQLLAGTHSAGTWVDDMSARVTDYERSQVDELRQWPTDLTVISYGVPINHFPKIRSLIGARQGQ